jgi:hypothetical protein
VRPPIRHKVRNHSGTSIWYLARCNQGLEVQVRVFDPAAFEEVNVLEPHRVRHHLARFDQALSEALEKGFRCDELRAENMVTQAQLLGFPILAEALSAAFPGGSSRTALRAAEMAVRAARPKIAELISAAGAS